ncbi:uncharacterized protein [Ptychodera flava]|uniref:uncharacterized protein n=1 Tax=Ptychodera flava TaxID=63121 RepID=UPI00396AADD8
MASHPTPDWEHAVFLGNINRELEPIEVKDRILQLLLFLGVTVVNSDLEVRYSKNSGAYIAFINLGRRDQQRYVYDRLSGQSVRLVDELVQDGRRLKVDFYRKLDDRRSGTIDSIGQNQNQNQGQIRHPNLTHVQTENQAHTTNLPEINSTTQDLSLQVQGHSIQMESRVNQSIPYEPRQRIARGGLSSSRDRSGSSSRDHPGASTRDQPGSNSRNSPSQVAVQAPSRSSPPSGHNQVQSGNTVDARVNEVTEVDIHQESRSQQLGVSSHRDRPEGGNAISENDEDPSGAGSTQLATIPQTIDNNVQIPNVSTPLTRDQANHDQSSKRQQKRRKRRRVRASNQQRHMQSSDSDSDDRLSTGTFTLEESESFLNKTYTLENDQSLPSNSHASATSNTSKPNVVTATNRPPSRLPRLKNRPPKTENPVGLKKLELSRMEAPNIHVSQQVLPKRSVSPDKRPPTRANSRPLKSTEKSFAVGQKLGNESRHLEYKAGGGEYLKKIFKEHIGKYVCAFLNSEGGTLMIGVADDGTVQGVHCDQIREDRVRRDIDSVIRNFKPQVFTEMYTVDFVPVRNQRSGPLKVIKITVNGGISDNLYESDKGEVYLRRDGSVQGPLKAHEIKEWCRLHHQKEIEAMKQRERDLQQEVELQKEVESKLRMDLNKQQKSKVCTIL